MNLLSGYFARFAGDRSTVQTRRLFPADLTGLEPSFEEDGQGIGHFLSSSVNHLCRTRNGRNEENRISDTANDG